MSADTPGGGPWAGDAERPTLSAWAPAAGAGLEPPPRTSLPSPPSSPLGAAPAGAGAARYVSRTAAFGGMPGYPAHLANRALEKTGYWGWLPWVPPPAV